MHKYLIATYKTTLKHNCKRLVDIPRQIDVVGRILKLAPTVEQVRLMCNTGRIMVNGNLVKNNYVTKQFDLIHTNFIEERTIERFASRRRSKRFRGGKIIKRGGFIRY